ncbi:hypothetical protein ACE6H2_009227 [Prunus campanulata]
MPVCVNLSDVGMRDCVLFCGFFFEGLLLGENCRDRERGIIKENRALRYHCQLEKKKKKKREVVVRFNQGFRFNGGGGKDVGATARVLGNLALAVGLTYLSFTGQPGWILDAIVSIWLLAVLVAIVGVGAFLWARQDMVQDSVIYFSLAHFLKLIVFFNCGIKHLLLPSENTTQVVECVNFLSLNLVIPSTSD